MSKNILLILLCLSMGLPPQARAWGSEGHQLIGAIADRLLVGTRAEIKLRQLFAGRSLAQVSTWADCVKNVDPAQNFTYVINPKFRDCAVFETEVEIAAMRDFVTRNHHNCKNMAAFAVGDSCHKRYHYTDLSITESEYKNGVRGTSEVDVVHAVTAALMMLQTKKSSAPFAFKDEREALLVLVHLLGDLHQPLHVGTVYLDDAGRILNPDLPYVQKPAYSFGGNALQLIRTHARSGEEAGTQVGAQLSLHTLWDNVPRSFKPLPDDATFINEAQTMLNLEKNSDAETRAYRWANASLQDAKAAFVGVIIDKKTQNAQGDRWNVELPLKYTQNMNLIKQAAIQRAGVHLAQVMIALYGA